MNLLPPMYVYFFISKPAQLPSKSLMNQPIIESWIAARKMKSLKRKLFVNRNQFQIDISRETRHKKRAQMLYIAKEKKSKKDSIVQQQCEKILSKKSKQKVKYAQ